MKKLVTFTASWCGPCKMVKPILQQLHDDKLIVWENYDIDENKMLAQHNNIKSVPTLIFYEDGNVTARKNGFLPKEEILNLYYPQQTVAEIIEAAEVDILEVEERIVLTPPEMVREPAIDLEVELEADPEFAAQLETDPEVIVELETEEEVVVEFKADEPINVIEDVDPEIIEDEFSDEDLGNDLPVTIDPDDLF